MSKKNVTTSASLNEFYGASSEMATETAPAKERKQRASKQLTLLQIYWQAYGLSNVDLRTLLNDLDKLREERIKKAQEEMEALK